MKKLLSMLLVVAMVLGLGIPAFAADVDPADAAADQAAILGLIVGDGTGDQMLDKALTRQEMAVIMYALNNGGVRMNADDLKTWGQNANILSAVIKDMDEVADWAKPYVAWTWSKNVFAGDGKGNFNPNANLSVVECAVLMLRALDADEVIHTGCAKTDGVCNGTACKWNENTIVNGMDIELFANIASTNYTKAITRGDIAVMLKNMLATNRYNAQYESFTGAKAMVGYYGANDLAGLKKTELFVGYTEAVKDSDGKVTTPAYLTTASNKTIKCDDNFTADMLYKEYTWYEANDTVLTAPEQTTGWTTLMGDVDTLKFTGTASADGKKVDIAITLGSETKTIVSGKDLADNSYTYETNAYRYEDWGYTTTRVSASYKWLVATYDSGKKEVTVANKWSNMTAGKNGDDLLVVSYNDKNVVVITAKTYYGWIKATTTDGVTTLSEANAPGENIAFYKYSFDSTGAIKSAEPLEAKSVAGYAITGTVNEKGEYTIKYNGTTVTFPDTNVDAWTVDAANKAAYVYENLISETGVVDSKNAYVYVDGNKLVAVELRTPTAETPIVQTYYYGYTAATNENLAVQYLLNVTTGEFVDFNNFKVNGAELSTIKASGFYTNTNGATVSDSDKDLVLVATTGNAPVNVTQYIGGEYAGKIWIDGAEKAVGNEKNKYNIVCVEDTELKTLLAGEEAKQVAILVTAADENTVGKYVVYDIVKASKAPTDTYGFYYIESYTSAKNGDKVTLTVNAIDVKNIASVTLSYADSTKVSGLTTGLVKITNKADGTYIITDVAESTGWTVLGNVTQYIGGSTYGDKVWIGGTEYTIVDKYDDTKEKDSDDIILANNKIVLNGDALTQLLNGGEVKQVVITNGKTDKDAVAVVVSVEMAGKLVYTPAQ